MSIESMIQVEVEKVQAILEKRGFPRMNIPFTVVDDMKKKNILAFARYDGSMQFNRNYFQHHENIPFAEVVAHEVCHIYQYKFYPNARQGHGPEFRSLMQKVGYAGKACIAKKKITGEAAKVYQPRTKTKTRHIYVTAVTNRQVHLTVQQHKKQQISIEIMGRGRFTSKGEQLVYTNKVKRFK